MDYEPQEPGAYLFVYGTLKQGHPNHPILNGYWTEKVKRNTSGTTKLITREGITIEEYLLLDNGYFPYMVAPNFLSPTRQRLVRHVKGEVYHFRSIRLLDFLDRLEGEGHHYHRHEIFVRDEAQQEVYKCWAYLSHNDYIDLELARVNSNQQYEW